MSRVHFMPVIAMLAALGLSAQIVEHQHRRERPRYKLIDLGRSAARIATVL